MRTCKGGCECATGDANIALKRGKGIQAFAMRREFGLYSSVINIPHSGDP